MLYATLTTQLSEALSVEPLNQMAYFGLIHSYMEYNMRLGGGFARKRLNTVFKL